MPCGLHSAISGILAGGILGFGTAGLLFVFAPSPRSCCDVWFVVGLLFARSFFNSSAHKLPSVDRARPSLRGGFRVFCCFGLLFWACLFFVLPVFCFWVVFLPFRLFAPQTGLFGLRNGPRSF